MEKRSRIYVAGAETVIGRAIVRELRSQGHENLLAPPRLQDAEAFFGETRPEYVFVAAGRSGGIKLNQEQGTELFVDNLRIAGTLLPLAQRFGVKKLLYLASSCVYPRLCPQPMKEEYLNTGPLEPTNEPYALAKLTGIKLCERFRERHGAQFVAAIPTNAFGPGDSFDPDNSHVIAALLRRFHDARAEEAPSIAIWGTGEPRREFLSTADMARACIFTMRNYDQPEPINLSGGSTLSIAELAELIKNVTGYPGEIVYDTTKPDGMPVKVLDNSKLQAMGWSPGDSFPEALRDTYAWFVDHVAEAPANA